MRGRKPVPKTLRILRGNPHKRAIPEGIPSPEVRRLECPARITGRAREIWGQMSEQLVEARIACKLDATAFELLVNSYVAYLEALEKVSQLGAVWLDKGEGKIPKFAYSPWWAIANREWKKTLSLLAEFGMTPSARMRVRELDTGDAAGIQPRKRG